MKNILLAFIFLGQMLSAQNVVLNEVVKTHSNTDKFLYKVDPATAAAEYLGEVEVQGFSEDDVKVFGMIYKKAKEIGANAFSYKPFVSIDESAQKFDPLHYKFSLYYVALDDFLNELNVVYFISSSYKKQTIALNKENKTFLPRTFTKRQLAVGETFTVSTKKLLGSSIVLSGQKDQAAQYFQFSAFSVNSNPYGTAGINLKSGDITPLEQSYGQFLTTIYEEVQ